MSYVVNIKPNDRPNLTATTETWLQTLLDVLNHGTIVSPQSQSATIAGNDTSELLNWKTVYNMNDPIIGASTRKLSHKFMFAEAWWILNGDNKVSTISEFNRHISKYSDDGLFFDGAYGPMVVNQISHVCNCLADDPNTRQAVMTIWRPNPKPSKDIPCTVSVQWMVRKGVLYCTDTMRSSDTYMGLPYDVFNFSCLSALIVRMLAQHRKPLNVTLGTLTMNVASQHIYHRDLDKIRTILNDPGLIRPPMLFETAPIEPMAFIQWLKYKATNGL